MPPSPPEASAPFHIIFEQRHHYLYVRVEGECSDYQVMNGYWRAIAARRSESPCSRVLVENEISSAASMADMFSIARDLPALGFSQSKLAFADRFAEHEEVNAFAEVVAANRGVKVRIFQCVNTAEKWLTKA